MMRRSCIRGLPRFRANEVWWYHGPSTGSRGRINSTMGRNAFVAAATVVVDETVVGFAVQDAAAVIHDFAVRATNRERTGARSSKHACTLQVIHYTQTIERGSGAGRGTVDVVLAKVAFVGHHQERLPLPLVGGNRVWHVESLRRDRLE